MKTILPSHPKKLKPKWPHLRKIKDKMDHIKHKTRKMTKDMGKKDLKPLKFGDRIREKTDEAKTWKNTGTIIAVNKRSRRYTVKLDSGEF